MDSFESWADEQGLSEAVLEANRRELIARERAIVPDDPVAEWFGHFDHDVVDREPTVPAA